ncbi:alpha mannosidase-like protein [Tulasnella sp. 418]|nr:alpha mannosidase-like protein [Tulasnella sp. 418]
MRWPWLSSITVAIGLTSSATAPYPDVPGVRPWTLERKLQIRNEVKELWDHGFNGYMKYAFPMDELQPLSCTGRGPNWRDPEDHNSNDVNGNFSATLIDVLDSMPIFAFSTSPDNVQSNKELERFSNAVRDVINHVSFDVNTKPQLFETTIRTLGGLISAHIIASKPSSFGHHFADDLDWSILSWYNGELLDLALDLGNRLLPAFNTPTKIPYARVNLKHGVPANETTESCTAGATSFLLEFILLSRLTSNPIFETVAKESFFTVWDRRSKLGMVGNTLDVLTGDWTKEEVSRIGAGIDSFFEYAFKGYVMTGEKEYLDVYNEAYGAVMKYSLGYDGFWYRTVNPTTGNVAYSHIDSMGAFWPGLMVLAGDIENGIKSHMIFWNIWRKYSGIPESFDIYNRQAIDYGYPLRPEFVESTYFLYRVTRDPFYLDVGERVLNDLVRNTKTKCGFATVANLVSGERNDRMESFMLSETLKYLYLLFDESNRLHSEHSEILFSTEGHLFILPKSLTTPTFNPTPDPRNHPPNSDTEQHFLTQNCRAYPGTRIPSLKELANKVPSATQKDGLYTSIRHRLDMEYARNLGGISVNEAIQDDSIWWNPNGYCHEPQPERHILEYILAPHGHPDVLEDPHPSVEKLVKVVDGFIVKDLTGVRLKIKTRSDLRIGSVLGIGQHAVSPNQKVYFADRRLLETPQEKDAPAQSLSPVEFEIRLFLGSESPTRGDANAKKVAQGDQDNSNRDSKHAVTTLAVAAAFGDNPSIPKTSSSSQSGKDGQKVLTPTHHRQPRPRFGLDEPPISVKLPVDDNSYGCKPHGITDSSSSQLPFHNSVLLIKRGECSFFEKMKLAELAGASGVIIVDPVPDDLDILAKLLMKPLIIPTLDQQSNSEPSYAEKHFSDVGMVLVVGSDELTELTGKATVEGLELMVEVVGRKRLQEPQRESTVGKNLMV